MQRLTQNLLGLVTLVMIVLTASPSVAQLPSWFPGSGDKEEQPAETAYPSTATPPPVQEPMVDSPMFDISWPKVEMPKFSWKPSWGGGDQTATKAPSENPVSQALDKVGDASKSAADSVRNAWSSGIARITPSSQPSNTQVANNKEPGFWSRMFGPEPKPEGSRTVTEFLAQERPGTVQR